MEERLISAIKSIVLGQFATALDEGQIQLQKTRKEFEGDITLVVFPLTRISKLSPEETGKRLGEGLVATVEEVTAFNVVKGFLNITYSDSYWQDRLNAMRTEENFGHHPKGAHSRNIMVEYSSPNTNKPLHLGHVRNNLLGYSVAEILKANGHEVKKVQVINDRGIHICKSMVAWQNFGGGETPATSGLKGDKLVGKYYVLFDKRLKEETNALLKEIEKNEFEAFSDLERIEIQKQQSLAFELKKKMALEIEELNHLEIQNFGTKAEIFVELAIDGNKKWKEVTKCFDEFDYSDKEESIVENWNRELARMLKPIVTIEGKIDNANEIISDLAKSKTELMREAQEMLRKWEADELEVKTLWTTMNGWVYEGFESTYARLGVNFDKLYFESDTYLVGRDVVKDGVSKGVFEQQSDGSIWCDLTGDGLDRKLLLRSDGTAVYMTQDIGTAILRKQDWTALNQLIYTVGNEQDYHFKVLFLVLEKLGYDWAKQCYHLSYGMVDLPSGKMKSREGTVVDADDLMEEMFNAAKAQSEEKGKLEGMATEDANALFEMLGMGALKYFILRVDPKKRMLFDPQESIDMQGNTGPFIQYTHARICSLLRKSEALPDSISYSTALDTKEKSILRMLNSYPEVVRQAGEEYSPALIANFGYDLAKEFNQFYQELPILKDVSDETRTFRLALTSLTGQVISSSMKLLGIQVPQKM